MHVILESESSSRCLANVPLEPCKLYKPLAGSQTPAALSSTLDTASTFLVFAVRELLSRLRCPAHRRSPEGAASQTTRLGKRSRRNPWHPSRTWQTKAFVPLASLCRRRFFFSVSPWSRPPNSRRRSSPHSRNSRRP